MLGLKALRLCLGNKALALPDFTLSIGVLHLDLSHSIVVVFRFEPSSIVKAASAV
jgi:hypothetical protein